ncbi:hypothetical protein HMSSN036_42460 [Paenibacillus macerans]|nr:hypothetical protein HMSSN036_42460 [Paenibacillus macerans]
MQTATTKPKSCTKQHGIDVEGALKQLARIKVSVHCWQGDDVRGFLSKDKELSGGIAVTGSYPGRARTPEELRKDLEQAFALIPGKHKVNLHAIYADTDETVDLDVLEPRHFTGWVDWAKEQGLGLDFNPTCFSHDKAKDGFTLSHPDPEIRRFWIDHCKASRKIAESFGKALGQPCVTNVWIPDGFKDSPVDRLSPRVRLKEALDEVSPRRSARNTTSTPSKASCLASARKATSSDRMNFIWATR